MVDLVGTRGRPRHGVASLDDVAKSEHPGPCSFEHGDPAASQPIGGCRIDGAVKVGKEHQRFLRAGVSVE
jgi:hypothetical protein